MTTLTLIRQPETASIALEIDPTGVVYQVLRSDAAGTRPVRALPGQLPTSGSLVLVDNEAALRGPVSYTVLTTVSWGPVASATTSLDVDGEWLTVPVSPGWSSRVDEPVGLLAYGSERESSAAVVPVIGRDDPLVNLGPLRMRTGSFDVFCATITDALTWERVYARGEVVQLRQQIPGLDMYHVGLRTRIAPDETRWRLSVDYQEVAWPSGDQQGTLGWSYDDVYATYASYVVVASVFDTYNDLTLGPVA